MMFTVRITFDDAERHVFLLSGSDNFLHVYVQQPQGYTFIEIPATDIFPELQEFPAPVTCMEVVDYNNQRIMAFGCQNGYLCVYVTPKGTQSPRSKNVLQQPKCKQADRSNNL